MRKIKHWLAAAGLAIASLFGYHHTIPETRVIEVIPQPATTPTPIATPIVEEIHPKIDSKRINISCDSTCTHQEKIDLARIVAKLEAVQSSKCVTDYLKAPDTALDVKQLDGMTLDAAIQKVLTSKVSTQLTYYYEGRNWFTKTLVIGYENGDGKVHANRAAWDYMSDCEKAGNLAHEISHQLGFHHDFERTARRPYSFPYVIGSAVEACCH
ncbi:MAG TPA: hypothetical protein PK522_00880 [Nitrosomonas sp.]|nr:hypothetical protein [Nitrosomonas sp.]